MTTNELASAGAAEIYMQCARLELDAGEWDRAAILAQRALREFSPATVSALAVLGLVRARRGQPQVWQALDNASSSAREADACIVAAARAEAAWLEGRLDAVVQETSVVVACATAPSWALGDVLGWRRRAGVREAAPAGLSEVHSVQLAGDSEAAARLWAERGRPYEAALALADAADEDALRRSLDSLRTLGGWPAAGLVARRLRDHGVRDVHRGPRATTRTNAANLTDRELEVLTMVSRGLRNAVVAERLFVSPRTVDHHVASIMRKLDGRTRGEAVAAATRLGILRQAG